MCVLELLYILGCGNGGDAGRNTDQESMVVAVVREEGTQTKRPCVIVKVTWHGQRPPLRDQTEKRKCCNLHWIPCWPHANTQTDFKNRRTAWAGY